MTVKRMFPELPAHEERNARTREALRWIGHVLGNYVTGDMGNDLIVEELRATIWAGLDPDDGAVARELDTLSILKALHSLLDEQVTEQARYAQAHGASWAQIGGVFGISKQAAWERFGERVSFDSTEREK